MSSCPPWYCDQFSIATAGELIQSLPFDRLAGRMLAPLTRITDATRMATRGSLSHRIEMEGRQDEFRELADAFDAMTSKRAYRDYLPVEKALKELTDNRRKQFDPDVVDAFLACFARPLTRGHHEQQRILTGTHS